MKKNIVIFGADGMLGKYVSVYLSQFPEKYNIKNITRKEFDITKDPENNLTELIVRDDIVINCAGLIHQRSPQNSEHYKQINSLFPFMLKKYTNILIHITSECVFNGKVGLYRETDKHDARDLYGISKSLGEPKDACVIRTSFIGEELRNKKSLFEWIKSKQFDKIDGYKNHKWNGTTCLELAKFIDKIITNKLLWKGTRHIFSPSCISKYDLIKMICDVYDFDVEVQEKNVEPKYATLSTIYEGLNISKTYLRQIREMKEFHDKLYQDYTPSTTINVFSNNVGKNELEALGKVFDSKWLFFGKETENFEKEFAEKVGSRKILMTNGCTNSMHMCLEALGIKEGDEVLMPTVSFVSCASSVKMFGATPVFCDVGDDMNIDPEKIQINNNTKAIIVLHYGGNPCDMDRIKEKVGNIPIIEDSACSTYSLYKGKACGTLGTFGCYSFDAMKIMCVGEAGAISINNPRYDDVLHNIRFLGLPPTNKSGVERSVSLERWWEMDIARPAIKYTPSDVIACITKQQLKKLDKFISAREKIYNFYKQNFENFNHVDFIDVNKNCTSCYYFFTIKVDIKSRDKLINYLKNKNIYCTVKYWPLNKIKIFQDKNIYHNTEDMIERIINIPIHQNITMDDAKYIVDTIKNFNFSY